MFDAYNKSMCQSYRDKFQWDWSACLDTLWIPMATCWPVPSTDTEGVGLHCCHIIHLHTHTVTHNTLSSHHVISNLKGLSPVLSPTTSVQNGNRVGTRCRKYAASSRAVPLWHASLLFLWAASCRTSLSVLGSCWAHPLWRGTPHRCLYGCHGVKDWETHTHTQCNITENYLQK